MKKNEPTKLFLNVETVPYRRPADANPFTYRETRPLRYRAVWVTRGTTCDLYKSKVCASQEEAVTLARKWLDKQNERPRRSENILAHEAWTGPRYVDTTKQPERFGYSLNKEEK